MNRKASQLPRFEFALFLGVLSVLLSGSAMGAIKDEESRILLERILEAHAKQSAALANYTFRAQWDTNTSGPGDYSGSMSGTIHRIHQGDKRYCVIRRKAATHSDGKRPPIPTESGHRFRGKAATDSDAKRPPIPRESGHPFRGKAATDSDGMRPLYEGLSAVGAG